MVLYKSLFVYSLVQIYYIFLQIQKLEQETKGTGMTLVPLKVYIKDGYAKLLLGLAKGKHDYDKRDSIKRREQDRDIARVMKAVNHR